MLFSVDIVLVVETRIELNARLHTWGQWCWTKRGLQISLVKMEYHIYGMNSMWSKMMKAKKYVLVSKFYIQNDEGVEFNVEQRGRWGWLHKGKMVKVEVGHKSFVWEEGPFEFEERAVCLLYGSECWSIKEHRAWKSWKCGYLVEHCWTKYPTWKN